MLLFAIIMFLPTRQLSRQKTYFFPSHFASISSCSTSLVGIIWGKNTVLYLENNLNTILERKKSAVKNGAKCGSRPDVAR